MLSALIEPAVGVVAAYLLGSIPSGLLIARARGVDIRKSGSGNIGATNVFRCVGKTWGVITFAADFLKGFLPAWLFPRIVWQAGPAVDPATAGLLFGAAAIAGHNWPIFAGFKGGKGVATGAGILAAVAPAAMAVGLASWVIILALTRYVSVASISAALLIAVFGWFRYRGQGYLLPVFLSLLALLVVWRHRANLRRLLNGTEHGWGKRK